MNISHWTLHRMRKVFVKVVKKSKHIWCSPPPPRLRKSCRLWYVDICGRTRQGNTQFACRMIKARIHTQYLKLIASWLIDSTWSRKMLYGNTSDEGEKQRNDLSAITISLAKLYFWRRPRADNIFWVQCQRLYTNTYAWFIVAGDMNLPQKRSATLRMFIQLAVTCSWTIHTECIVVFLRQQWLRDRSTVLRYTYIAYLVFM
jgi:hypothetical protein